jgi:hypothetical protein
MPVAMPPIQEFSSWNGTPFFEGYLKEGRHAYVIRTDEGEGFLAYGVLDPSNQCVFRVHGTEESQLEKFVAEMRVEGAAVTYGAPPFDIQTGGDKPPTKDPSGIKKPRPMIPQ